MTTKNWHRAVHDAERERYNALAQLAHEQATRREWQTQYQAEHRDYLNQVEAERDRLRDGIKALMRVCPIDAANRDQSRKPEEILILRDLEDRLRALLDGEAKG